MSTGEPDAAPRDVAPAVDAATVMLVRPSRPGVETLLLERHVRSEFGGALVFPGGVVDEQDRGLSTERWYGRDPATWRELLGVPDAAHALGLLVAAVRETFEEAGVLLATRRGRPVTDTDLAESGFVEVRRRLASRDEHFDWRDWLADEDLVLDLGALAPWSWWVTPKDAPKRFDTRFFVARAPRDQDPLHDDHETIESLWVRPAEALARFHAGDLGMFPPTVRNLEFLAPHANTDEVLAAAASVGTPPTILPKLRVDAEGKVEGIAMPDDPDYEAL